MLSNRVSSLKSKSDFRELVVNGKKAKAEGWLTLDYIVGPEGKPQLQFGLSISRKIGSAVIRNRIKRWSREFFRKALRDSDMADNSMNSAVKLNLRLRENGEFYKNLRHSEFDIALGKAWGHLKETAKRTS